jgi:hypothetical protein
VLRRETSAGIVTHLASSDARRLEAFAGDVMIRIAVSAHLPEVPERTVLRSGETRCVERPGRKPGPVRSGARIAERGGQAEPTWKYS